MLRNKIKKLCSDRGITVRELEISLGMSGNTITRWTGTARPSVNTLLKVANALGVSVDELLREETA